MMLTPAEMLAQAKTEAAERMVLIGRIEASPCPKPWNVHIQWALAVAMNRLPASTVELGRYVHPGIRP